MRIASKLAALLGVISLCASIASGARADALDDIISRGTIRIAIDVSAPPFGFQNEEMQPDGADVAAAKLLASDLGVKLDVVPVMSSNRLPYLQSGRTDLTMSTLAISPERAKAIDFSSPYGIIRSVVLAPKSVEIKSPQDLLGKKISVARGTTNETDVVNAAPPGTEVIRFDDEAGAMNALATGQVDAYAVGEPLGAPLIKRYPHKGFETKLVMRVNYLAIGVRRGQTGLLQWLNTFVYFHMQNGDLPKIYKKYIGTDLPPLPPL
jgi:polar amino acid transport system substrate-binding protein